MEFKKNFLLFGLALALTSTLAIYIMAAREEAISDSIVKKQTVSLLLQEKMVYVPAANNLSSSSNPVLSNQEKNELVKKNIEAVNSLKDSFYNLNKQVKESSDESE